MSDANDMISIQLCYATPEYEFLRTFDVPAGSTLEQALRRSGLLEERGEIELAQVAVGIYGKKKTLHTILRAHDRVEVYRPLLADPKESRRRRARNSAAAA